MAKTTLTEEVIEESIRLLFEEFHKAEEKHPGWPEDQIHCAAIVAEEAGELVQAAIDHTYQHSCPLRLKEEAAQTAAMGLRFLVNLIVRERGGKVAVPLA